MPRAAALILLLAALNGASAFAAPTATEALADPQPAERDDRVLQGALRSADSPTGSRTIDLLIDMQQRSAGLQFNERQRPARSDEARPRAATLARSPAAAAQPTASPRLDAPPVPPSGLFGSGATPMVQSARTASIEPRGAPGADVAPPRRLGVSSSGEPLPRWLMLPREIIGYVRENRWLVLGSVAGGLLLIWGVSSLFARAAANAGRVPAPRGDRALSADRRGSHRQETHPARRRSHRHPG